MLDRENQSPGKLVGIDRALIERLVQEFYTEVRRDPALGPIFNSKIQNWGPHVERMVAFWSSIALMTGEYKGKPLPAHMGLGIRNTHFARWLTLFEQTARRVCPPPAAEFFIDRAQRIALSLRLGIGLVDPLTDAVIGD